MNTKHIHNLDDAIGLAAQIVYEYPDWNCEHCHDMIQSYDDTGEHPPCDVDDLYSLCHRIAELQRKGHDFHEATERLTKELTK